MQLTNSKGQSFVIFNMYTYHTYVSLPCLHLVANFFIIKAWVEEDRQHMSAYNLPTQCKMKILFDERWGEGLNRWIFELPCYMYCVMHHLCSIFRHLQSVNRAASTTESAVEKDLLFCMLSTAWGCTLKFDFDGETLESWYTQHLYLQSLMSILWCNMLNGYPFILVNGNH